MEQVVNFEWNVDSPLKAQDLGHLEPGGENFLWREDVGRKIQRGTSVRTGRSLDELVRTQQVRAVKVVANAHVLLYFELNRQLGILIDEQEEDGAYNAMIRLQNLLAVAPCRNRTEAFLWAVRNAHHPSPCTAHSAKIR